MADRWIGADSRQVLSAGEQSSVERFQAAVRELESLSLRLPAVLHVMRDCEAGQPRAAATHREGDDDGRPATGRLWCWDHEQELARCFENGEVDRLGRPCTGELGRDISDPVGDAAVLPDRARRDRDRLLLEIERLSKDAVRVLAVASNYPTTAAERDRLGADDEIGTVWCRSCWKDNQACEPVYLDKRTNRPEYVGLCRWCGRTRKAIGGNLLAALDRRGDPPLWMVEKHRRGERISPGDIERAARSVPGPSKEKDKGQSRGWQR